MGFNFKGRLPGFRETRGNYGKVGIEPLGLNSELIRLKPGGSRKNGPRTTLLLDVFDREPTNDIILAWQTGLGERYAFDLLTGHLINLNSGVSLGKPGGKRSSKTEDNISASAILFQEYGGGYTPKFTDIGEIIPYQDPTSGDVIIIHGADLIEDPGSIREEIVRTSIISSRELRSEEYRTRRQLARQQASSNVAARRLQPEVTVNWNLGPDAEEALRQFNEGL